jgi:hypothetical protein
MRTQLAEQAALAEQVELGRQYSVQQERALIAAQKRAEIAAIEQDYIEGNIDARKRELLIQQAQNEAQDDVNQTIENVGRQISRGIGDVGRMTSALANAAGAGEDLQSALQGAFGAMQGLTQLGTALASSNPMGILGGLSGIVTSIAGMFGNNRAQQQQLEQDRQDRIDADRRLADMIGDRFGEELDKRQIGETFFLQDNDRQVARNRSRSTREDSRALARERQLNPGAI